MKPFSQHYLIIPVLLSLSHLPLFFSFLSLCLRLCLCYSLMSSFLLQFARFYQHKLIQLQSVSLLPSYTSFCLFLSLYLSHSCSLSVCLIIQSLSVCLFISTSFYSFFLFFIFSLCLCYFPSFSHPP